MAGYGYAFSSFTFTGFDVRQPFECLFRFVFQFKKTGKRKIKADINEYVDALKASPRLGDQVVYHTVLPRRLPSFGNPDQPWPAIIKTIMASAGAKKLYTHQVNAINYIRSGRHVVIATPTASGKSMIYNLPVIEKVINDSRSKALYIFPLKALAQDQMRSFEQMTAIMDAGKPTAAIYDGDTSAWFRKRIREHPPNLLLTNPEMIHLSLLPHHPKWAPFLSDLKTVVVDEVHTYRGVMGSHMAQVFRRLARTCAFYGASPGFIFCSATVSNPTQLTWQLTGLNAATVTETGAPQGKRHLVCINPVDGPAQTAILLLKAALHRGLRTIVYTQSRKLTELIAFWAGSRSGRFADKISAYRAGFLPEERRDIEARLSSGKLLAVISTSALELGIDIGDLDLCILVGYPGTMVATWQRGGRVGRGGQDSALMLVAGEDALDQYFMHHPQELLTRESEAAVINPYNRNLLEKHLLCAAAEFPLKADEPYTAPQPVSTSISNLAKKGELLKSKDGTTFFSKHSRPHRQVNLRGSGSRFTIVCSQSGRFRGEIDAFRAFKETHPGAVYLHKGETFLVDTLDLDTRTAGVTPAKVNYYTRVRAHKDTEILEIIKETPVFDTTACLGRLKVREQVTGFETWRIRARKKINITPLDLPPQIFETDGLWFNIPETVMMAAQSRRLHFMGGIHALEHAAIGIFPLLVMVDRNDLGGISTPYHPQTGGPAVFIYDAVPDGAGLSRQAFKKTMQLLETTLKAIQDCPCDTGCPSCVHSPKCGSGNRPIDKTAAIFVLESMLSFSGQPLLQPDPILKLKPEQTIKTDATHKEPGLDSASVVLSEPAVTGKNPADDSKPNLESKNFAVIDIETQRSAAEVGGWHRADLMGVSCVVLYDAEKDRYIEYMETHITQLIDRLSSYPLIIGFNIKRFDYRVLKGYTDYDFSRLPTLDILEEVHRQLGFRLSLDNLAKITLGTKKSASGLQALKWWQEGRIREIIDYCRRDVAITRDLFIFGRQNGYLLFENKAGHEVRIPVNW
jgi:DEAD/DEAH box helicase domain-containing protein